MTESSRSPMGSEELAESLELLGQHLIASDPVWVANAAEALAQWDAERSGRAPPVWDRERESPQAFIARLDAQTGVSDP